MFLRISIAAFIVLTGIRCVDAGLILELKSTPALVCGTTDWVDMQAAQEADEPPCAEGDEMGSLPSPRAFGSTAGLSAILSYQGASDSQVEIGSTLVRNSVLPLNPILDGLLKPPKM